MPHPANASATSLPCSVGMRCSSTWLHDVPPAPATSIAHTPASHSLRAASAEMPQPTSLAITGTPTSRHTCSILRQPAREVGVALGLHRLLQRVEMQDERVGLDHLDRAAAFVHAVGVVQLHRAHVREQRDTSGATSRT